MKRDIFEEFSFKDNAELINLEHQMKNNQFMNSDEEIGFNNDFLYNNMESKIQKDDKRW